jgi:hypothetical protein
MPRVSTLSGAGLGPIQTLHDNPLIFLIGNKVQLATYSFE